MYKTGIEYSGHPRQDSSFNSTTRSTLVTPSSTPSRHLYQIEIATMCKY